MKIIGKTTLSFAALMVTLFSVSPSYAAGGCAAFPDSKWWGNTDHKKVISYVSRKHNGDWSPYIEKWGAQLNTMKEIIAKGGSAVFKSREVTLSGDMLQQYIDDLVVRVDVTKCLSRHATEEALKETKPDS